MKTRVYENQLPSESVANACPFCGEDLEQNENYLDRLDCTGCDESFPDQHAVDSEWEYQREVNSGI